jgi:hypothetical protein
MASRVLLSSTKPAICILLKGGGVGLAQTRPLIFFFSVGNYKEAFGNDMGKSEKKILTVNNSWYSMKKNNDR